MRGTLRARIEVSHSAQEGLDPHRLLVRRRVGEVGHERVEQRPARLPELLLAGRPAFLEAGRRRRRRGQRPVRDPAEGEARCHRQPRAAGLAARHTNWPVLFPHSEEGVPASRRRLRLARAPWRRRRAVMAAGGVLFLAIVRRWCEAFLLT